MVNHTASIAVLLVTLVLGGAVGVGLALGTGPAAGQNAPDDSEGRTITVTGQGSAEAAPDQAVVAVAVVAEGDDPAAVRDDLTNGSDALRSALANASVPEEDVETVQYSIREPDRHSPEGEDAPAYRGVHAFQVTVEIDRAGAVIDAAADAGAEVQGVGFTLSEELRNEVRDEALETAMDDARHQADTIASASDLRVTGVRHVDATERAPGPVFAESADAGGGTTVSPGDVTVRVQVHVTYDASATNVE